LARFDIRPDKFEPAATVYFTEADCTGDAYMTRDGIIQPSAYVVGTDVWYPDTAATLVPLTPASRRDSNTGACINSVGSLGPAAPAYNFTLPTYTPPFHVGPEACFTPDEPDPEQFINGCISKNGTLKIVADPADCTPRETPISWLGQ